MRFKALTALLLLALPTAALAGSFSIAPILLNLQPGAKVATYTLQNTSKNPLHVQISAWRWTQAAGKNKTATASSLLVIPKIASLQPGQSQLVRIAFQGKQPANELAYRIHFREIPPAPKPGFTGVRTALEMNVPLFFMPRQADPEFSVAAQVAGGSVSVAVENSGNEFVRVKKIRVLASSGNVLSQKGGPLYALPGATRRWTLKIQGSAAPVKAVVVTNRGRKSISIGG